jgi:nucleotide-binding universal stress UspA family protein
MPNVIEPSESTFNSGDFTKVQEKSFQRILVPVESFGSSSEPFTFAESVCRAAGGEMRVVHVRAWDEHPKSGGRYYTETSEQATAILDKAINDAWGKGLRASGVVIEAHRPAAASMIVEEAAAWGADVIVLPKPPKRAFGFSRGGGFSARVIRRAPCPIALVRTDQ